MDIPLPLNYPDPNPFDFFLKLHHERRVVEDFAKAMDPEIIRKVCGSARTKFEMMRKAARGGHFERIK